MRLTLCAKIRADAGVQNAETITRRILSSQGRWRRNTSITMLEKPDIPDEKIIDCLRDEYGLKVVEVAFLPLGADRDTAVYRVLGDDATPYFVKLRRGAFDEITVIVPKLLHDQGIQHVIAPLPTRSQQLWASLGEFRLILSPFIDGRDGFEVGLSDRHWVDFGRALKSIHTAKAPPAITSRLQRETYSPKWREIVKRFQLQIEETTFADPAAAELAAFLKFKQDVVSQLVGRAERLAAILQTQSLPFMLCHADIHAWNILIETNGALYIVDWDTLILAPKERDLMFIGGGLMGHGHTPEEEEALFYQGYGCTQVDPIALAYYRCERIVQDIAAYCEQILLTDAGGADRAEGLRQLKSQFLPNEVVELAFRPGSSLMQSM
jgi:spectinomycin phosphotransferase